MATREHRIGRYVVAVEVGSGFGRLSLWSEDGTAVGEIGFVDDGRSLPATRVSADLAHGIAFLPASRMGALISLLRHERDVFLALSDEPPGFVTVRARAACGGETCAKRPGLAALPGVAESSSVTDSERSR